MLFSLFFSPFALLLCISFPFFSFFLFNNFIIGICILSLLLISQQKKICIRIVIHMVDHLQPIEAVELDLPAKRKDVGDRNVNCKLAQSSFINIVGEKPSRWPTHVATVHVLEQRPPQVMLCLKFKNQFF